MSENGLPVFDKDDGSQVRLLKIIHRALDGQLFSLNELAKDFDCSEKTILRTISLICAFGFQKEEILNEPKRFKLSLLPDSPFYVGMVKQFASKTQSDTFFPELDSIFITSLIEGKYDDILDIKFAFSKFDGMVLQVFRSLIRAISQKKVVSFSYHKKRRENVKPIRIFLREKNWYIYTILPEGEKVFNIRDIQSFKIEEEHFTIDKEVFERIATALSQSDTAFIGNSQFCCKVLVDKTQARRFLTTPILPSQKLIKQQEDGGALFEISASNKIPIFSAILEWLPNIKIIEPIEYKKELLSMLKGYIKDCEE